MSFILGVVTGVVLLAVGLYLLFGGPIPDDPPRPITEAEWAGMKRLLYQRGQDFTHSPREPFGLIYRR